MAHLKAEDIDWRTRTLRFFRDKTDSVVFQRFGQKAAEILRRLPQQGYLLPYLATVRASDRATEFKQRCQGLGIKGGTLHCYRYAWAHRAGLRAPDSRRAECRSCQPGCPAPCWAPASDP
jgi:integrase